MASLGRELSEAGAEGGREEGGSKAGGESRVTQVPPALAGRRGELSCGLGVRRHVPDLYLLLFYDLSLDVAWS